MRHKHTALLIALVAVGLGAAAWLGRLSAPLDEGHRTLGDSNHSQTTTPSPEDPETRLPAQESIASPTGGFPPALGRLKSDYLLAASRRDYEAMRKLNKAMRAQARGTSHEKAVLALIARTLREVADASQKERHAPSEESIPESKARSNISQLRELLSRSPAQSDPAKVHLLLRELLGTRLPNDLLQDVRGLIDQTLGSSPPNASFLKLLNSFVTEDSAKALYSYASAPYPPAVRMEALSLLSGRELTDSQLERIISDARRELSPEVKAAMLIILRKRDGGNVADLVQESLSDANPTVRAAAAAHLDPDVPEQRASLIGVLQDPSPTVRRSTLRKLSRFTSDPEVLSRVLYHAKNDPSEIVRVQGVQMLQKSSLRDSTDVINTLKAISESDQNDEVKLRAQAVFKVLVGQ